MPTYSPNYQIKLITTGDEAGTWGESANENLKKIEQALGTREVIVVNTYDVPNYTSNTLTWLTDEDADAYTSGSEGRARVFEFQYSGTASVAQTVKVRGDTGSDDVDRVFFVYNNIGGVAPGQDLILDSGGGTYTVKDGAYAAVYTDDATNKVGNLLSTLQIEDLVFPATATITVPDSEVSSLVIEDVSNNALMTFDSDEPRVKMDVPIESDSTLKLGATTSIEFETSILEMIDQDVSVQIRNVGNTGLKVKGGSSTIVTIDGPGEEVIIENLSVVTNFSTTDLTSTGTVNVNNLDSSSASSWELPNSTASALTFHDVADAAHLVISTNSTGLVAVPVALTVSGLTTLAADVQIQTTSTLTGLATVDGNIKLSDPGYINFDGTDGDSGIGIRNSSGIAQIKNTGGATWDNVATIASTVAPATDASDSENKKGSIDVGPVRFYFDRDTFPGETTRDYDYGSGGPNEQFDIIWQVIASPSSGDSGDEGIYAKVLDDGTGTTIRFRNQRGGTRFISWLIIGLAIT